MGIISLFYPVMVVAVLDLERESNLLKVKHSIVVLKIAGRYF